MAIRDYGAVLKVDGKIINTEMFMKGSDTGYVLDKAKYRYDGEDHEIHIDGNFFVYAGDKELLLTFYKESFYVIENKVVTRVFHECYGDFASQTFKLDNGTVIEVSHIDKELKPMYPDKWADSWQDYVREMWYGTNGNEPLSELEGGYREYKRWIKHLKRIGRHRNKPVCYDKTRRYIAKWKHNNREYEVIFGYGIDPDVEVYKKIQNMYEYTPVEIEFIDKWFGLEK